MLAGLLAASPAAAGMPFIKLSEVGALRVEAVGFFVAVLLGVAFVAQRLWNALQRDVPKLPRLSYRGALALLLVWGLALQLVLSMISGARELMTPGAWTKVGRTYRLTQAPPSTPQERDMEARLRRAEELRAALWAYADAHAGPLPPHDFVSEIAPEAWRSLDPSGMRYVYLAGRSAGVGEDVVAYEPRPFGKHRVAILSSGEVVRLSVRDLRDRLDQDVP